MLRHEKKYLVPNHLLDALREGFQVFVRPDVFSRQQEGLPQYTVRSVYFDSRRMDCYQQKIEGLLNRRKFRIRGYHQREQNTMVALEIKRKYQNLVKKQRSFVRFDHLEALLVSGDIEKYVADGSFGQIAKEHASRFLFHLKKNQFIPTCLITYEREAYHGLMDEGVRITFDKNVRSVLFPSTDMLFEEKDMKPVFPRHFILEVKYFTPSMPVWARSLVQEFKLRNDALSKYTRGIDAHGPLRKHFY